MSENTKQQLGLVASDPWLQPVEHEVEARYQRYLKRLGDIEKYHDGLQKFADAYNYLGINYDSKRKGWTYREWAPKAKALFLFGDFNDWNRSSHPLTRDERGVWELFLDEQTYKDKFVHQSKVKVLVYGDNGTKERIPAYIRRVIQDDNTKDFTAQVWLPEKKFSWTGDNFDIKQLKHLYIYECHVGMAQEKEGLGTFVEFEKNILPRIKKMGYNTIQMMAVAEHPYYGSFGYHVANFFAVSSRFGTPEELKSLIKAAHKLGIAVIMDLVHSHTVKNINEGINEFDGSQDHYFHEGARGEHPDWDSKLFNYGKIEVTQFLLSNVKYWLEEFHFDGYRFDGVSSLMYFHHGNIQFGSPYDYYCEGVEWDSITYLQLANKVAHSLKRGAITIAEDVSGMPGLTFPIDEGGIGFDYRLGMGIPDFWIKIMKEKSDEDWDIYQLWQVLNDRKIGVGTIAYSESHDQALVGDKTLAFWLMDKEMYFCMRKIDQNLIIDRGIALHKMIRLFTLALGGNAYLNFMGNEFGHPEWIDFPREGNGWSYKYARRQWSLVDRDDLKYHYLADFESAMIHICNEANIFDWEYARQINMDAGNKTLVFERNKLIFVFNFHTHNSIPDYEFPVPEAGTYQLVLNSDGPEFGGHNRIDNSVLYHSLKRADGADIIRMYNVNRAVQVFKRVE